MIAAQYPRDQRRKMRAAVRRLRNMAEQAALSLARGTTLNNELSAVIERVTGTNNRANWPQALHAAADGLEQEHLSRLLPLAHDEFNAFCEYVDPAEPPESKWHEFLTDELQDIETNPTKNHFILNCPAGVAKPLHDDTPVLMEDGTWKRLADVVVDDVVITHTGVGHRVTAVHVQGDLPLLKITTASGRVVYSAHDHPFMVRSKWKNAVDLRPGDPLEIMGRTYGRYDVSILRNGYERLHELAAYWLAYGALAKISGRPAPYYWLPTVEVTRQVRAILDGMGVHYAIHPVRKTNSYALRLTPTKNAKLIKLLMADLSALDRRIPEWVFALPNNAIKKVLSIFVSARAEVPKAYKPPRLMFYMRSIDLAVDLQRLFATQGISTIVERPDPEFGGRPCLVMKREAFAHYLGNEMTFNSKLADRVAGIEPIEPPGTFVDPVLMVESAGAGPCRCLTVDVDHTFIANGAVVSNSTYASRKYIAWRLGRDADQKIIGGGHSQKFVEKEFSKKVRDLVSSPTYRDVFPEVILDAGSRANDQWGIAGRKGQYVARGVGQGIHGFRANFICIDDPYEKIEAAESPVNREKVQTWFITDIDSRLLPDGKVFVIQTRMHEEDLSGFLLELNKKLPPSLRYHHVNAPAICYDAENDVIGRQTGEVLWDFYSHEYYLGKKLGMKSQRFSLIYQQNDSAVDPDNVSGRFLYFDEEPQDTEEEKQRALAAGIVDEHGRPNPTRKTVYRRVVASVDTASKPNQRANWSVVQIWAETRDRKHFLLYQDREKVDFNNLIEFIEKPARKYGVSAILVEDKGNGLSYIQNRAGGEGQRRKAPAPVVAINPGSQSKEFRFDEVTPMITGGEVYLPTRANWTDLFLKEVSKFPFGANDDQVDAMSQYLAWVRTKGKRKFGSRQAASMG